MEKDEDADDAERCDNITDSVSMRCQVIIFMFVLPFDKCFCVNILLLDRNSCMDYRKTLSGFPLTDKVVENRGINLVREKSGILLMMCIVRVV